MKYVVYGAGGVGGTIGARLFQQGIDVTLIARGEHGQVIAERGLHFVSPTDDVQLPIPVVAHPQELSFDADTLVLLCMKTQHTTAALQDLASCAPPATHVSCVQNGVANERMALRLFANTYATVVNLPALFLTPGEVVTHATGKGGILDTGCFPGGVNSVVETLTSDLERAGFSARPQPHVMRQKYAKMLMNLANVVQAGLSDYESADEIGRRIRTEALACFSAADIDCADRQETRDRHAGTYKMGEIPGFPRTGGSSWQSAMRGTGDIETDYLNGEICLLGRLYDVPTPANDICVALGREIVRAARGPGIISCADLLARIEAASSVV